MAARYSTSLNGKRLDFEAEVETSALDVIRKQGALTGTKLVCGSGACGACTILVEGEARCACLMPALHLEGKAVQTVEAHATEGLHPVQKAFLAHDALQCGYCTPGFINEGIAFYNDWRRQQPKARPTKDQIAKAMAGHYCRCGAYQGIYEAMMDACEGKYDGAAEPTYLRHDGPAKVTGAAKYTTDIALPGQLVGKIFRSPFPHCNIESLDLSAAASMPGVKAVVRLKEDNYSAFAGEALAAVAAESEEVAHAALAAIQLKVKELPFVTDIAAAMAPNAVQIFADDRKKVPVASEAPPFPGSWEGNVRKTLISISGSNQGKAKRKTETPATASATHLRLSFQTPTQFHTTLESHCAVADWQANDALTVYASTQGVYYLAKGIAEQYGLKVEQVKVNAEYVGGAFGAKLTLYTAIKAAIELSRAAKAPVGVVYDRAEELTETGFRPSAKIDVAIAADADGSNAAYTMDAYADSGCAIGSNIADISGLGYTGISKSLQDYDVLTNFQPGAAFRGPGGPAACFALEQAIDQLAFQMKMDPIAFRRKWEKHPGYVQLFDWVERLPLWQQRKAQADQRGRYRKGVGVAFGGWMHIYMPIAEVVVEASPAGLTVRNAVQDMGQGARSVLSKAMTDVFGLPASAIRVELGQSTYNIGPTSGGSRTTASIYPAAVEAARKLQAAILKTLDKQQSLVGAQIVPQGIQHATGLITWQQAFERIPLLQEKATRGHNDGLNPMGMVPLPQGMELGQNRTYGVYVAEVMTDTQLGRTVVTQVHGAMRVGKVHVRPLAESQCQGGVIQGIGHVLYEDRAICPQRGIALTRGLEDYRIPGIGDTPDIHIDFIEEGFDMVKEKGVGLAELCTIPVAGSVANAVFNATGYRALVAPITPARLLAGLKSTL
jgi:xanthine dehydrogenase YagR molybdenum-binding subunit